MEPTETKMHRALGQDKNRRFELCVLELYQLSARLKQCCILGSCSASRLLGDAGPCSKAEITTSCSNPIEHPIQKRVSLIL